MTTTRITDLSPEAFAPYGEVFAPAAVTSRLDHVAALQNGRAHAKPNLFLARSSLAVLPHRFDKMESHPASSQSFLLLGDAPVLVAAALPGPDGTPDLSTLRAFTGRNLGFSYRAGVWHIPVATLDDTLPIAGFMYEDGTPQDCVWADVAPVTLTSA